ncbi:MAG: nuclear transport factor 2 family protein [Rubrivivax sp.]|nr:nuclear transport factor 2 family protein [Pyrinomonadaceae bacterium]
MKTLICAILLTVAMPAAASGQQIQTVAGNGSRDQQAVIKILRDWLGALARNDLAAVERIIADDYVITAAEGVVLNKERDLAPLRSGDTKFDSASAEDVNVRVFGHTAIVTGIAAFSVRVRGKAFDLRERFTDVYVKRKGRWQPVSSHTTPLPPPPKMMTSGGN